MPAHAMVLGCGRSGTSIFGELFDGLGDYAYRSEPPFAEVMTADFSTPQAFKVPHESPGFPAAPGLSFPLRDYLSVAPDATLFWIVRHPLDAVCSLMVGIEKDWGHHPRPPDWRDWLDRPLLERCAHHWAFLNTAGFRQVDGIARVVRFEAMIADPLAFAKGVCAEVGADAAAEAAHLERWSARVQDTNNAAFIEARTSRGYSRPDHERRVGRWRDSLTRQDAQNLWPILAEGARPFGYGLD